MQVVAADTETTGVNPKTARLVTCYMGLLGHDGSVIQEFSWVVNPGIPVPVEASDVHGWTTERLASSPEVRSDVAKVLHEIRALIEGCKSNGLPLAFQNAAYDLTVLDREMRRHGLGGLDITGIPVLDSLVMDKHLYKFRRGNRKLITLAEVYGIPFTEEEAHNADFDAKTAGRIILKQLRTLGSPDLHQLHEMQGHWRKSQQESLQEWLRANKDKDAVCETDWPLLPYGTEEEAA